MSEDDPAARLAALQADAVARARTVLAGADGVVAGWLAGSHAAGRADAYSDVDVHAVVEDASADHWREHWPELAAAIAGPLVLADPIPGLLGGLAITPDWLHLDVVLTPRSAFDASRLVAAVPLHDPEGLLAGVPRSYDDTVPGEPWYPERTVTLFLYLLGLVPMVAGRGDVAVIRGGVQVLTDRLVELFLAERGLRRAGGIKRVDPYLDAGQRAFLDALPPATNDPGELVHADAVIAREFLRRGRGLAVRTGADWPAAMEDATRACWRRHLGVDPA